MTDYIIYISLKNEGIEVWRPMYAERVEDMIYKIVGHPDYDPNDEELEFLPGEIVLCEIQSKSGEDALVAIRRN